MGAFLALEVAARTPLGTMCLAEKAAASVTCAWFNKKMTTSSGTAAIDDAAECAKGLPNVKMPAITPPEHP
jgi:hypothetical protein